MTQQTLYVGFDPREIAAYAVTVSSILRKSHCFDIVKAVVLNYLTTRGSYNRPTEYQNDVLFDKISGHPMSTEFAISRFLVPYLNKYQGWALFTDCDMLALSSLDNLPKLADPKYAVMVVKHNYQAMGAVKMDGQVQSNYNRKNWSSVCWWNCAHPSNKLLTPELVNKLPGRDLHAFCWLADDEIGELPPEYNYLVGVSPKEIVPILAHFTNGVPHMKGYHNCEYADLWRLELQKIIPNFLRVIGTIPA